MLIANFTFVCTVIAQRYSPEFSNPKSEALFERAEKAYVKQNYKQSAKLYDDLIQAEGESYQLIFNKLTSIVHTVDTTGIEETFTKLTNSPFLECNYLTLCQDFKGIKYRKIFQLWQNAVKTCSEKEKKYLEEQKVQLQEVRKQLLFMKCKDAESDVKVIQKLRYGGYDEVSFDSLRADRAKIYAENFVQLQAFIATHGWLGKSLVGADGAEAAWVVALHAVHLPIEQAKLLNTIKASVDAGEAEMRHYAYLFDQVCANYKRPQRFGTLRWKNPDSGVWEVYTLEDPAMVNEFRKEAGLPPLQQ